MPARPFRAAFAAGALATVALAGAARAQTDCHGTPSANRLFVVVENITEARGLIASTLYGSDTSRFLKSGGSLSVWRTAARPPSVTMCVFLPKAGDYAVGVYQDLNSNHKIDKKMLPPGPAEPWGFTNNPHALFALPNFGQVRFSAHAGDNTVHIRLNHP